MMLRRIRSSTSRGSSVLLSETAVMRVPALVEVLEYVEGILNGAYLRSSA